MSQLPQRRKSPEEIAKLRESFGVPSAEPATGTTPDSDVKPAAPEPENPPPPAAVSQPKPVRSLRKSELAAEETTRLESPPDSNIPHRRHSNEELEEIRRREVLAMMNTTPNRRLFPAHPALIAPGYIVIAAAVAGIGFYSIPLWATAVCALISFAIAGLVFARYPVSRHHAAFISVLALLLLVFASLYYFPQLRHAT